MERPSDRIGWRPLGLRINEGLGSFVVTIQLLKKNLMMQILRNNGINVDARFLRARGRVAGTVYLSKTLETIGNILLGWSTFVYLLNKRAAR